MENVKIPTLYPVKQALPKGDPVDIDRTLESDWDRLGLADQVQGKRIALGFGSRGVASIDLIAKKLVALVKASGGEPFIVPAMGSHGGATPAGQIEVLDGLGISEETMGCPIRATMEVVDTGVTSTGLPAYIDKNVYEADGLIISNRTKVHTDFHGPHESGLLKMLAIGLGKETGARTIHQQATVGLRDYMPVIAQAPDREYQLRGWFRRGRRWLSCCRPSGRIHRRYGRRGRSTLAAAISRADAAPAGRGH